MRHRAYCLALIAVVMTGSHLSAQLPPAWSPPPAPTSSAAAGAWDVAIVRRAAQILASPAQWNRSDSGSCPAVAQAFSIACALQKAVEEGAGIHRDRGPRAAGTDKSPPTECSLHASADSREGSCGALFDEMPVFTMVRAAAITSGRWRDDVLPVAVWAGTMSDAESPVSTEADQVVGLVTTRKYDTPVAGYNNDSTTTFANVQDFFHLLEDRVAKQAAADLGEAQDVVEIEVYAGGTGVIRTYAGWFAVSGFAATDSTIRFRVDTTKEIPASALDRTILERAATVITADSVWNRADNRKCPATATRWSIYCAVERAEIEVTGGFHHRRPAMELVREIVDERTAKKSYQHRLMGYNNDPATHLDDVKSLFAEALARIR